MKKFLSILFCLLLLCGALAGCDRAPEQGGESLDLIDFGLEEKYLPVQPEKMFPAGSKVDVHLTFTKEKKAWEAVVREYNKFQPRVRVTLNDYTGDEYQRLLQQEVQGGSTDWDIFHGNYIGATVHSYAYDMYSSLSTKNPYAGNQIWKSVLDENAYVSDTSGRKVTYIMNSESLMTAWFVNRDALRAAGIEKAAPETWDELIEMCAKLKTAGYSNPLGIAGANSSITYDQFCWLLRVYGDQYFRDMLARIQPMPAGTNGQAANDFCYNALLAQDPFVLDLNAEQPEAEDNYVVNNARKYWTMLDESSAEFVGPKSEKYGEFISQLAKMKPYLPATFNVETLETMRANFIKNSGDKTSPVFLLDYYGSALSFADSLEAAGSNAFELGIFDYVPMQGKNVKTQFMRDVGGNGGYLSVMDISNEQTELTMDFMKFFMSPYGQSVYYAGLKANGATPGGESTVRYMKIPESWAAVFSDSSVSFSGLCDMNPYTNAMLWTVEGRATVTSAHADYVRRLFAGGTVEEFQASWQKAIFDDYQLFFKEKGWKLDCYTRPWSNLTD